MTNALYNSYKVHAMKGDIAPLIDTIAIALLTAGYTPDIINHKLFSDVNANEVVGTGYTAGGQALGSVTVTEDDVNNRSLLDAANPSWPSSTLSNVRYAAVYKNTGNPATSPLIGYIDFGTAQATSNATFIITLSTSPAALFYLG